MRAAVSMTTAQRQELQRRVRDQEVAERTLREQVESNRDLLAAVEHEVQQNQRLGDEAGRELGRTQAIAAGEVVRMAQQVA